MNDPFDKDCPNCGAHVGEPCIGKRGPRRSVHQERGRRATVTRKPFVGADEKIERMIADAAQLEAVRFEEGFDFFAGYCESPIEKLLLAALYANHRISEFDIIFMGDSEPSDKFARGETIEIYQQAKVGPYRVDFLVLDASVPLDVDAPRWMIVECDGHDFHERTKEQARRDKQRDRFFQSKGWKVLRFTGSEIWEDPEQCADEVLVQLRRDDSWRNRDT